MSNQVIEKETRKAIIKASISILKQSENGMKLQKRDLVKEIKKVILREVKRDVD